MFESIMNFFKNLRKTENKESKSKETAKERLHLVLMQDRANVSADFLEMMKQEIIDVIKKYIEVDEKEIDVRLTNEVKEDGTTGAPSLYANIPIVNIKNEMKKEVEENQENKKEEIIKTDKKEEEKEENSKEQDKNTLKENVEEQKHEEIKEEQEYNKEEIKYEEKKENNNKEEDQEDDNEESNQEEKNEEENKNQEEKQDEIGAENLEETETNIEE